MTDDYQQDKELLRRCASGDLSAFDAIYKQHVGLVYSVCLRRLRNVQDAEDATSACFVVLLRKAGTIAGKSRLATWLYSCALRIAQNAARMHQRRVERETRAHDMDLIEREGRERDWEEILPHVERQIGELPAAQREALILHFYGGLSVAEMAERLGCAEGSIRSRMHSGMKTLRRKLAEFGGEMSEETIASGMTSASLILPVPYGVMMKLEAMANGEAAGGSAIEIARTTMRGLMWTKAKVVAAIAAATLVAGGGAYEASRLMTKEEPAAVVIDPAKLKPRTHLYGRVLFEDNFDHGLDNWEVVSIADGPRGIRVEPVTSDVDRYATTSKDSRAGGGAAFCVRLGINETAKGRHIAIRSKAPLRTNRFMLEVRGRIAEGRREGTTRILSWGIQPRSIRCMGLGPGSPIRSSFVLRWEYTPADPKGKGDMLESRGFDEQGRCRGVWRISADSKGTRILLGILDGVLAVEHVVVRELLEE